MKLSLVVLIACCAVTSSGFAVADIPAVHPPHVALADIPAVHPPHLV